MAHPFNRFINQTPDSALRSIEIGSYDGARTQGGYAVFTVDAGITSDQIAGMISRLNAASEQLADFGGSFTFKHGRLNTEKRELAIRFDSSFPLSREVKRTLAAVTAILHRAQCTPAPESIVLEPAEYNSQRSSAASF